MARMLRAACVLAVATAFTPLTQRRAPSRRLAEDGGKQSLADSIAALSKGALSREELESAVKAEETAAGAGAEMSSCVDAALRG